MAVHLGKGEGRKSLHQKSKVLYVAFHYPPAIGSSGTHRTIVNSRVLGQRFQCNVLTCSVSAYDHLDNNSLARIPLPVTVIRAWAWSAAKTLSIKGKHLAVMTHPDNWQSWIPCGVLSALFNSIRQKPKALVSTYPIPSALVIGYVINKLLNVPWIVDLRDPLLQDDYPVSPAKRKIFKWLELKIVKHASVAVITTKGTQRLYQQRFPLLPKSFWQLIPNGFDDEIFDAIEEKIKPSNTEKIATESVFTLLHSGVIYPSERDPLHLFNALAELKKEGEIDAQRFNLRLRATGHDELYSPILKRLNISDIVELVPLIPFEEAVEEMFTANALLIMQDANCNEQIPAKTYEYIRVGRPILALTPEEGDTGQLLSQIDHSIVCPLDDKSMIKKAIVSVVKHAKVVNENNDYQLFSRTEQAKKFSTIVEGVMEYPDKYRRELL